MSKIFLWWLKTVLGLIFHKMTIWAPAPVSEISSLNLLVLVCNYLMQKSLKLLDQCPNILKRNILTLRQPNNIFQFWGKFSESQLWCSSGVESKWMFSNKKRLSDVPFINPEIPYEILDFMCPTSDNLENSLLITDDKFYCQKMYHYKEMASRRYLRHRHLSENRVQHGYYCLFLQTWSKQNNTR